MKESFQDTELRSEQVVDKLNFNRSETMKKPPIQIDRHNAADAIREAVLELPAEAVAELYEFYVDNTHLQGDEDETRELEITN